MATAATSAAHNLHARSDRRLTDTATTLLAIAGSMIAVVGLFIALAGLLAETDAAIVFTLVGFGMVVSGALLAKRRRFGVWTYMTVYAGTMFWSLHGMHPGGSSLGYRFIGPITLLVLISLLMPILGRWSRRRTVTVCAVLIIATVVFGSFATDPDQSVDDPTPQHFAISTFAEGPPQ